MAGRKKVWMTVQEGTIFTEKKLESVNFQFGMKMNTSEIDEAHQLMDRINGASTDMETANHALIDLMQMPSR